MAGAANCTLRTLLFPRRRHHHLRHLLPIAHRIIRTEGDHPPVGDQEFHAALHSVLGSKSIRVHKIAGVDHKDVPPQIARLVHGQRQAHLASRAAIHCPCRGWLSIIMVVIVPVAAGDGPLDIRRRPIRPRR